MPRPVRTRPRLIDNPRAFCAASSLTPLVWLSYVLPGARPRFEDDRPLPTVKTEPFAPFSGDRKVVTPSRKISLLPSLAAFARGWVEWRWPWEIARESVVVGWGYRKSGRQAQAVAAKKQGQFVLVEDGFLRSVERNDSPIGLCLDDGGIYYDAASDSRLFELARQPLTDARGARARAAAATWRAHRLSKYNGTRDYRGALPDRFVLVVDQVRDDLAIRHGGATQASFDAMLDAALAHDPDVAVVVKIHPDSAADPRKSHFDRAALERHDRVHLIADTSHVANLVSQAEAVFTVTSQVGFEALLHDKPVHVFGMPFYSGWGLTKDALERPEGRGDIALEQLVHAALIDYPRYFNPASFREMDFEEAAALVGLNRSLRSAFPSVIHAHGFSAWKRPFVRQFVSGSEVRFVNSWDDIPDHATVLLWGRAPLPPTRPDLTALRIEDGFLRSSGLGADLTRPLSLVIDDLGIYYDATAPSRLEHILETVDFSPQERARAAALRDEIIAQRLSKYNLGGEPWARPDDGRRVILVVGQVEDDASVAYGSPEVKSNLELLRRTRRQHPDDFLLYKPHPDVVAGLRVTEQGIEEIETLCDEIIPHADPVALLERVDEVHTMTSLMGFEALLRGKAVTCHGMPFYAGWGLTRDMIDCARRTRTRTLDELVHAALIDYPRYFSRRGGLFVPPEDILVELSMLAASGPASLHPLRKAIRPALGAWKRWSSGSAAR